MSELEIWNELGNIYYNNGDHDQAVHAYEKAIEQGHACVRSLTNLASIYIEKEFFPEAILLYQKGLQLMEKEQDKAVLWNRLGDVYLRLDDNGDALTAYQTAVKLDPENADLQNDLERAELDAAVSAEENPSMQEGVTEQSPLLEESRQAETGQPTPTVEEGDPVPFPKELEQALEADLQESGEKAGLVDESILQAISELPQPTPANTVELESACWIFQEDEAADTNEPFDKEPVVLGNRILFETKEENEAVHTPPFIEAEAMEAAEAQPVQRGTGGGAKMDEPVNSRARALLKLGLLRWCKSDHENAVQYLKTALNLAAIYADHRFEALCYNAMGRLEVDRGNSEEAIRNYENAASLDPVNIFPWCSLGHLYSKDDRYEQALAAFKKAIEHDPQDPLSWNGLGDVYAKLGRTEEAISAYQLGNVLDGSVHDQDAIAMVQMAAECEAEDGRILEEMGNVNYMDGTYDEAIEAYTRSIDHLKEKTDLARLWKRVGDAHQRLNELDLAEAAYEKAIELGPESKALKADERETEDLPEIETVVTVGEALAGDPALETTSPAAEETNTPETAAVPFEGEAQAKEEAEPGAEEAVVEAGAVPASAELSEETVETAEAAEPEPAQEEPPVPTERPIFPKTMKEELPSPDPAYWVFPPVEPSRKESLTVEPLPQRSRTFRLEAEAGVGNVKPGPTFLLPKFAAEVDVEAAVLTQPGQDEAGLLIEEKTTQHEPLLRGYAAPAVPPASPAPASSNPEGLFLGTIPHGEDGTPAEPPQEPPSITSSNVTLENDIAAYRRVTEINPLNDRAWDALGNMYEAIGLHNEAINAFEKAISLASQREVYHYHLGLAHAAQKRYDKAILCLQKVVALNPEYMLAHCALAGFYRRLDKETEAKEHIAIARPYIENENDYNQACFESICGNIERALDFLRKALDKKQVKLDLVRSDPDLDFIRSDPRFEELIAKRSTGRLPSF